MFLIRILILALASLVLSGCSFPLSPLLILMLVETPAQIEEPKLENPTKTELPANNTESELIAKL